jgi:lysophospholipase L1-like esterase
MRLRLAFKFLLIPILNGQGFGVRFSLINSPTLTLIASNPAPAQWGNEGFNVKSATNTSGAAKGDGITDLNCTLASGTATLSTTTSPGPFKASHAGQPITVVGAGAAGADLVTTILSFQSATAVTLAANAGTSVAPASGGAATGATTPVGAICGFGTNDTASFNAAFAAASAANEPAIIPGGTYHLPGAVTRPAGLIVIHQGPVFMTAGSLAANATALAQNSQLSPYVQAAGALARNWPLEAGIPQLLAGGQEIQITASPTGIPASVAANTTVNVALTTITGLLATDILIGVQKAATQAGLAILPADLALGGVTGANAATVRYVNDTVGAIVPTAAESYVFTVLRNAAKLPTVTLSAANAATSIGGSQAYALSTLTQTYCTISGAPVLINVGFGSSYTSWPLETSTYSYYEFISDAPQFEWVLISQGNNARLSVNGQLLSSQSTNGVVLVNDGNAYRILVNFGTRAFRRHRLEIGGPSTGNVQAIQALPTDTVMAAPRRGAKVIWMDNSMGESIGATDSTTGFIQTISWLTGWDLQPHSYGGIGYISRNMSNGNHANAGEQLADITGNAPDGVVWQLGINDYNLWSASQIQAAAFYCYQKIKNALPNVPQIVLGPEAGTGNSYLNANWTAARDAIKRAAQMALLPFADPIGTGYLRGTGKVGTPLGDGNADYLVSADGTHPSQAGHDALARVTVSVMAAALAG